MVSTSSTSGGHRRQAPTATPSAPLFDRLPVGWSVVVFEGRRYGVTRSVHGGGRSQSIYAEALDGSDVVSANLYDVGGEGLLRPCEMPDAKVLAFLQGLEPDTP